MLELFGSELLELLRYSYQRCSSQLELLAFSNWLLCLAWLSLESVKFGIDNSSSVVLEQLSVLLEQWFVLNSRRLLEHQ